MNCRLRLVRRSLSQDPFTPLQWKHSCWTSSLLQGSPCWAACSARQLTAVCPLTRWGSIALRQSLVKPLLQRWFSLVVRFWARRDHTMSLGVSFCSWSWSRRAVKQSSSYPTCVHNKDFVRYPHRPRSFLRHGVLHLVTKPFLSEPLGSGTRCQVPSLLRQLRHLFLKN